MTKRPWGDVTPRSGVEGRSDATSRSREPLRDDGGHHDHEAAHGGVLLTGDGRERQNRGVDGTGHESRAGSGAVLAGVAVGKPWARCGREEGPRP